MSRMQGESKPRRKPDSHGRELLRDRHEGQEGDKGTSTWSTLSVHCALVSLQRPVPGRVPVVETVAGGGETWAV